MSAFEQNQLKDYFGTLLPPILGAEGFELDSSLWSMNETTERLKRFINDPQVNAIYFTKKRKDKKGGNLFFSLLTVVYSVT